MTTTTSPPKKSPGGGAPPRNHSEGNNGVADNADGDIQPIGWAAKELGIGLSTAYRLASAGQLPGAFRVSSNWRISKSAFWEEVAGRANSGTPRVERP